MPDERIIPINGGLLWAKREMEHILELAAQNKRIDIIKCLRNAYEAGVRESQLSQRMMFNCGYDAAVKDHHMGISLRLTNKD